MFNKIVLNKVTFTVLAAVLFAMYAFAPSAQAQQQSTQQMQQLIQSLLQQVQELQRQLQERGDRDLWGQQFQTGQAVFATDVVRIRQTPDGEIIGRTQRLGNGTVVGGPQTTGGHTWYRVRWSAPNVTGWSAAQFLEDNTPEGINPPTPPSVPERPVFDLRVNNNPQGSNRAVARFDAPTPCSSYEIDWGDGNVTRADRNPNVTDGNVTTLIGCHQVIDPIREVHEYRRAGTYTVTVTVPGSNLRSEEEITVGRVISPPDPGDPIPPWDELEVEQIGNGEVEVRFRLGQACSRFSIDWGDGTMTSSEGCPPNQIVPTVEIAVTQTHRYEQNGRYTISVNRHEGRVPDVERTIRISNVDSRPDPSPREVQNISRSNAPLGPGERRVRVAFDRPTPCHGYEIDWGDGNTTSVPAVRSTDAVCSQVVTRTREVHRYREVGNYDITIRIPSANQESTIRARANDNVPGPLVIRTDNNVVTANFHRPSVNHGYEIRWGDGNETRVEPCRDTSTRSCGGRTLVSETHAYQNVRDGDRKVISVNILGEFQHTRRAVDFEFLARPQSSIQDISTAVTAIEDSLYRLTAAIR